MSFIWCRLMYAVYHLKFDFLWCGEYKFGYCAAGTRFKAVKAIYIQLRVYIRIYDKIESNFLPHIDWHLIFDIQQKEEMCKKNISTFLYIYNTCIIYFVAAEGLQSCLPTFRANFQTATCEKSKTELFSTWIILLKLSIGKLSKNRLG